MRKKCIVPAICVVILAGILIAIYIANVQGKARPPAKVTKPTAPEIIYELLEISIPENSAIENYTYHRGKLGDQGFSVKIKIDEEDLADLEKQIVTFFGEPKRDIAQDIIRDDTFINNATISRICQELDADEGNIGKIYFKFGTGDSIAAVRSGKEPTFATYNIYILILNEEDGRQIVCISY